MSKRSPIVTLHASRRGTGKSTIAANTAVLAAATGLRVGVVDADLRAAGQHLIFNLDTDELPHTLNDFLNGDCALNDATVDLSADVGALVPGALYLTPASSSPSAVARIARNGYSHALLADGLRHLVDELMLDLLLVDAPAGLSEQAIQLLATTDRAMIVLRPDHQNYMGTAVTISIAAELGLDRLILVVNEAPVSIDTTTIAAEIEQSFKHEVSVVFPYSDQLSALGGTAVFTLQYPDHAMTDLYRQLVRQCVPEAKRS